MLDLVQWTHEMSSMSHNSNREKRASSRSAMLRRVSGGSFPPKSCLQVQAMWSPVPRILPSLALLGRYQAIVHQNVPERHGFARHPYVSPRSTIPLLCIGFERLGINCVMLQNLKKFQRLPTVGVLQTFVGNKRNKLWKWMRSQSLSSWNFGMGDWWSQCSNLQAVVEYRQMLALFLLCHWWLEGVSNVHWVGRPDSEQNLYDSRGGRKHPPSALRAHGCTVKPCATRSSALDVEMFAPFAASLLEVSDSSSASLVHSLFSNAVI